MSYTKRRTAVAFEGPYKATRTPLVSHHRVTFLPGASYETMRLWHVSKPLAQHVPSHCLPRSVPCVADARSCPQRAVHEPPRARRGQAVARAAPTPVQQAPAFEPQYAPARRQTKRHHHRPARFGHAHALLSLLSCSSWGPPRSTPHEGCRPRSRPAWRRLRGRPSPRRARSCP